MDTYVFCLIIIAIIMSCVLYVFNDVFKETGSKLKENIISQRKYSIKTLYMKSLERKSRKIGEKKNIFLKFRDDIERLILKANVKVTFVEFLGISALSAIIGWILAGVFNNILIQIVLTVVAANIPYSYLNFITKLYKRQVNEQLEPVLSQIINLLPTKKSFVSACESVVETMNEPLKTFFTEFINNINNANRSFEESLHELAQKIDCKQFNDFERIALIHYRQGGDTVYAFSSIPENIRDIKMIQSEQEAELDSLRIVGYLFVFSTPLSIAYYYFSNKEYFNILTNTAIGKVIMTIIMINLIVTVYLIRKLSEPVEM